MSSGPARFNLGGSPASDPTGSESVPSPDSPADCCSPQLIDAVLKETLGQLTDQEALEIITEWLSKEQPPVALTEAVVARLARHIVSRRFLGVDLSDAKAQQLGSWLWQDPQARKRLETLWLQLGNRDE